MSARSDRLAQFGRVGADTDAFAAFYGEHYPAVVRILVGLTGRWAVAEELAQEAMLAAHRNWDRVATLDRPDLWVRRVAINRAVSAHRRVVAEVAAVLRLNVRTVVEPDTWPEDAQVWKHVARLPRRQAASLVLSAVDGLTFEEVGSVLGCSAETARSHLRRARARLQEEVTR
jgi:RNA polymerase sigma factor (sigma-70 family)